MAWSKRLDTKQKVDLRTKYSAFLLPDRGCTWSIILAAVCAAAKSKDSKAQSILFAVCVVGQSKNGKAQSILTTECVEDRSTYLPLPKEYLD